MTPAEALRTGQARIMTMGVDRTATPPCVIVHIIDGKGSHRGTLDDAQRFIDEMRADFQPPETSDGR